MRKFQDTFETCMQSFISTFSFYMTVLLNIFLDEENRGLRYEKKPKTKQFFRYYLYVF